MDSAAWLCTPAAVRARGAEMLELARAGGTHFAVDAAALPACADYVTEVIRANYPMLDIPHHARWRHFAAGGVDRWGALAATLGPDAAERARVRIDLCVTSVLLDAGSGPAWRYREDGRELARSEGLGVASLDAFRAGLFSSSGAPIADAAGLSGLETGALGRAFQVTADNPLAGLEGRASLLRALGGAVAARPDLFPGGRPGGLFDTIADPVTAPAILHALLDGLGPIWPGRVVLEGRNLGDVWPHPALGLVPFHKLSQWLAYSMIEVFEDAGRPVGEVAALTGLPEYRNGGLLLDAGVLSLRAPAAGPYAAGDSLIVEWRALTVALLDALAGPIRARLGRDEAALPLSRILEGGTWAAGRALAATRRPGGGPPLQVISDGTVF